MHTQKPESLKGNECAGAIHFKTQNFCKTLKCAVMKQQQQCHLCNNNACESINKRTSRVSIDKNIYLQYSSAYPMFEAHIQNQRCILPAISVCGDWDGLPAYRGDQGDVWALASYEAAQSEGRAATPNRSFLKILYPPLILHICKGRHVVAQYCHR